MFGLATRQRAPLHFTVLGEPPLKMLRYQQQYEFFDHAAVHRSVHFINLSDEALTGDFDNVLRRIVAEVETHAPGFVFVDSFRSMSHCGVFDRPHNELQLFVLQLGTLMTSWQATTFLLGGYSRETEANPVITIADGMIHLQQSVERNAMVRKLEIAKMRGQSTLPGLHTSRISDEGIRVFAPAVFASTDSAQPPQPGRALMGVPELDRMLGGGVPRGHPRLLSGLRVRARASLPRRSSPRAHDARKRA